MAMSAIILVIAASFSARNALSCAVRRALGRLMGLVRQYNRRGGQEQPGRARRAARRRGPV